MLAADVSWKWLRGRLATREWNRVHRGVFRLGCNPPTREEREMAALMAAGTGAVLSHISAARKLGLDVPPDDSIQITIPASRKSKVRGARIWRSRRLTYHEVTKRGRFRLTTLPRTLIDLAAVLEEDWLRAAFDSAVRQHPAHFAAISRELAKHGPGCRGVARLRALLSEYQRGGEVPDSALERIALELAKQTGRQAELHFRARDGRRLVAEVDLAWPDLRLCAELDGWKYHRSQDAFAKDRSRDRNLFHLGWSVLRYVWADVVQEPDAFIEDLARAIQLRAAEA